MKTGFSVSDVGKHIRMFVLACLRESHDNTVATVFKSGISSHLPPSPAHCTAAMTLARYSPAADEEGTVSQTAVARSSGVRRRVCVQQRRRQHLKTSPGGRSGPTLTQGGSAGAGHEANEMHSPRQLSPRDRPTSGPVAQPPQKTCEQPSTVKRGETATSA